MRVLAVADGDTFGFGITTWSGQIAMITLPHSWLERLVGRERIAGVGR
jgi:hypothetical protein